ncbi:hypothetical protein FUAX_48840 (plasmid) [Fulvitalea axinellae]|uniref:DUF393 domain-containing protein n=1 Tax=Fulvitalea axinellae TaxID=1182444 RepID=A0AAU9CZT5_9BACT|nr:hypothetical protein FUAX_48840 [Fulvitalea axinellae]
MRDVATRSHFSRTAFSSCELAFLSVELFPEISVYRAEKWKFGVLEANLKGKIRAFLIRNDRLFSSLFPRLGVLYNLIRFRYSSQKIIDSRSTSS